MRSLTPGPIPYALNNKRKGGGPGFRGEKKSLFKGSVWWREEKEKQGRGQRAVVRSVRRGGFGREEASLGQERDQEASFP